MLMEDLRGQGSRNGHGPPHQTGVTTRRMPRRRTVVILVIVAVVYFAVSLLFTYGGTGEGVGVESGPVSPSK